MKKLQAIIRPFKVDDAKQALGDLNVGGMTVSEVIGLRRPMGHSESYRGAEYAIDFLPEVCLEVIVPDDLVDKAVMQLSEAVRTGSPGDGKIFVLPVEDAVRIRTGDRGDAALT